MEKGIAKSVKRNRFFFFCRREKRKQKTDKAYTQPGGTIEFYCSTFIFFFFFFLLSFAAERWIVSSHAKPSAFPQIREIKPRSSFVRPTSRIGNNGIVTIPLLSSARCVCVCVCAPPITRDGRVVSIVPWSPAHPFHPFPGLVQYRLLEPPARQGPRTAPGSRRSSINRRGAWTRFVFLSPFAR